jgi:carboxyl-terminal processing protease
MRPGCFGFVALVALALLWWLPLDYPVVVAEESPAVESAPEKPAEADAEKAAATKPDPARRAQDDYELYQMFIDTLDQVERNYVKDVSRRELLEAAIEGVLSKLDPYSSYIDRDEINRFKTTVESQFGGIGIQIGVEDGKIKVISPLAGTPAYKAGILAGDTIVEIDGKPVGDITLDEAVKRLKGEAGTAVSLTVQHADSTEKKTVAITREMIHVETVMGDRRKPDDSWDFMLDRDKHIGYIRLTSFSRDTTRDLTAALKELKEQGLRGLVLDLRFNPGGLLTSAVEISDLFLPSGRIVSTQGRNTAERTWEAVKEGTFDGFPMAVLVNRYSASASEIVSAALQDHDRAVVIGERTWGKGSVQNVIELEGGKSALKLTTAGYRRPNGHNIHRFPDAKETDEWGVMPNDGMELKLSDTEMAELLRIRRDRDILVAKNKAAAEAPNKEAAAEEAKDDTTAAEDEAAEKVAQPITPADWAHDKQLQKAVEYITALSDEQ